MNGRQVLSVCLTGDQEILLRLFHTKERLFPNKTLQYEMAGSVLQHPNVLICIL